MSVEVDGASVPIDKPREPNAPDPAPQASELPHTGGDVTRLALWGVTLMLMGAALVDAAGPGWADASACAAGGASAA